MNTYSVTTGVLTFEGEPVITEGLKAWLEPLTKDGIRVIDADMTHLGVPGVGLYQQDEDSFMLDELEEAVGIALRARGIEPAEEQSVEELVMALIEASGQSARLQWLADIAESGEHMDPSQLVECALWFGDGHNAKAAALQTGIFSDKTRLWSFGGYAEVVQRRGDGTVDNTFIGARDLMTKALGKPRDLAQSMGRLAAELVAPEDAEAFLSAFNETFTAQAPSQEAQAPLSEPPARPRAA